MWSQDSGGATSSFRDCLAWGANREPSNQSLMLLMGSSGMSARIGGSHSCKCLILSWRGARPVTSHLFSDSGPTRLEKHQTSASIARIQVVYSPVQILHTQGAAAKAIEIPGFSQTYVVDDPASPFNHRVLGGSCTYPPILIYLSCVVEEPFTGIVEAD